MQAHILSETYHLLFGGFLPPLLYQCLQQFGFKFCFHVIEGWDDFWLQDYGLNSPTLVLSELILCHLWFPSPAGPFRCVPQQKSQHGQCIGTGTADVVPVQCVSISDHRNVTWHLWSVWISTRVIQEGRLKRNPASIAQCVGVTGYFCPIIQMSSVNQFCIVFLPHSCLPNVL